MLKHFKAMRVIPYCSAALLGCGMASFFCCVVIACVTMCGMSPLGRLSQLLHSIFFAVLGISIAFMALGVLTMGIGVTMCVEDVDAVKQPYLDYLTSLCADTDVKDGGSKINFYRNILTHVQSEAEHGNDGYSKTKAKMDGCFDYEPWRVLERRFTTGALIRVYDDAVVWFERQMQPGCYGLPAWWIFSATALLPSSDPKLRSNCNGEQVPKKRPACFGDGPHPLTIENFAKFCGVSDWSRDIDPKRFTELEQWPAACKYHDVKEFLRCGGVGDIEHIFANHHRRPVLSDTESSAAVQHSGQKYGSREPLLA